MDKIKVKNYGLTDFFINQAKEFDDLFIARVIAQNKNLYRVVSENGELFAEVSGKFRFSTNNISDFPSVGDFVMLDRLSDKNGNAIIHKILTRKSCFVRKSAGTSNKEQVVASNIDTVFFCMSLNNDFNVRRLERYLTIGWDSGALPVIVLTKSDLCPNLNEKILEVESIAMGVDIVVVSSINSEGYKQLLLNIKKGQTIAIVGSSGVGKSTLINHLLKEDLISTNGLRNDDKGRHTTTRREMFLLENGGLVIDTPGMRELGMWDSNEGLDKTFSDIENLLANCKYSNCNHTNERGCAILEAIKLGELSEDRWQSYKKLQQENAYMEDKNSYLIQKEKFFKEIAKINKGNNKKK